MSPSTRPGAGGTKARTGPAVEVTGPLRPGPEPRGKASSLGHGLLKPGPARAVTLPRHSSRATLWKRKGKKKGNQQAGGSVTAELSHAGQGGGGCRGGWGPRGGVDGRGARGAHLAPAPGLLELWSRRRRAALWRGCGACVPRGGAEPWPPLVRQPLVGPGPLLPPPPCRATAASPATVSGR